MATSRGTTLLKSRASCGGRQPASELKRHEGALERSCKLDHGESSQGAGWKRPLAWPVFRNQIIAETRRSMACEYH